VQNSFFSIAHRYDLINTLFSLGLDALWRRKTARALISKNALYCLDFCAGTLTLSKEWLKRHPSSKARLAAVDFCSEMLVYGKNKKCLKKYLNNIDLICADGERLSCSDDTFDCAMVAFGIRNLANPSKGLEEIYRVLKHDGRIAILEFSRTDIIFFKQLYYIYLHYIMPVAGKILVRNEDAYTYLADSIETFYTPRELVSIMQDTGFKNINIQPMTFGTVHLYTGQK
jgi:demethylmenaquinone methyltransferase/2-methoxy-6-polyprenyl-1,4-benzoquinol methylase